MPEEMTSVQMIPPYLAIAGVRPDHLQVCIDQCCTGASRPPRLDPGAITFLRRTSGGLTGRRYGVVAVWWFTGQVKEIRSADYRWPRRWSHQVQFEPLVQLSEPFCEMFTETPVGITTKWVKASAKASGLIFTALQGTIVRIRDPLVAANYVEALLKEQQAGLQVEANYQGNSVLVSELLSDFAGSLRKLGADYKRPSKR